MENLLSEQPESQRFEPSFPMLPEVRQEPFRDAHTLRPEPPLAGGERAEQISSKQVSGDVAQAIEAGAQKGRERIAELRPQSLADLRIAARAEFKYAELFGAVYANKTDRCEAHQRAYKTGMRSVASVWYREKNR
jgi:hypothetical protein